MADANLKIDIPGVDFGALAQSAVAQKLTEAFMQSDQWVTKIVAGALSQKVGSDGKISQYSSDNRFAFVEWMAMDLIRKSTHAALVARVEAMQPQIQAEIERQLKGQAKHIAKALSGEFARNVSGSAYGAKITVNVDGLLKG